MSFAVVGFLEKKSVHSSPSLSLGICSCFFNCTSCNIICFICSNISHLINHFFPNWLVNEFVILYKHSDTFYYHLGYSLYLPEFFYYGFPLFPHLGLMIILYTLHYGLWYLSYIGYLLQSTCCWLDACLCVIGGGAGYYHYCYLYSHSISKDQEVSTKLARKYADSYYPFVFCIIVFLLFFFVLFACFYESGNWFFFVMAMAPYRISSIHLMNFSLIGIFDDKRSWRTIISMVLFIMMTISIWFVLVLVYLMLSIGSFSSLAITGYWITSFGLVWYWVSILYWSNDLFICSLLYLVLLSISPIVPSKVSDISLTGRVSPNMLHCASIEFQKPCLFVEPNHSSLWRVPMTMIPHYWMKIPSWRLWMMF